MTICVICKKRINYYPFFYRLNENFAICTQCFSAFPVIHKNIIFYGVDLYVIYAYRAPINSYLMELKMKNDIALSMVFLSPFKNYIKCLYKDYIILPIPSTKKSDKHRGFNHVVEIAKVLELPIKEAFYKSKEYKQTSQRFEKRSEVNKIIKLKSTLDKKKKYLLLDDVITSGSTLKACIDLLKKQGINSIKVLVICDNYRKK